MRLCAAVQSEMLVKGGQGSLLRRDDVLAIAKRKVQEGNSDTQYVSVS